MQIEINLNETVRVKLTDRGLAIMRANHDELRKRAPSLRPFREPEPDAEGRVAFQLWALFQEFGQHMAMGVPVPFETTIVFRGEAVRGLPPKREEIG